MEQPIETFEGDKLGKHLIAKLYQDPDPMDPRENDNLGTMATWHNRYNLGDEQPSQNPADYLADLKRQGAVVLPLYLMDHSGLSISTGSAQFQACDSHGWDWGQVGFIFALPGKIKKEYGWKLLTKKRRALIEEYLTAEVEGYNQYLNGDVYGYVVEDVHGEHVNSCWGFFGYDYAVHEAQSVLAG